jgi:hypothetical protein
VAARGTAMFAAAVLATAGCGGTDPDDVEYQATCHDAEGVRVDDEYCDDERRGTGLGFFPLFWVLGSRFPAIGQRSSAFPGAVRTLPAGAASVNGGASRTGGTVTRDSIRTNVTRGGFGTTSRGGGTGG